MSDPWIAIGAVIKPHGVRGALRLHLFGGDSGVLRPGLEVQVGTTTRRLARVFGNGERVEFEGLTDRNEAEAMRGQEVSVRRDDFPEEDDDEYYLVDLVGADVFDTGGARLGQIAAFSDNGAHPVAELKDDAGKTRLVPFVPPLVVDVDVEGARVVVDLPEGLLTVDDDVAKPAKVSGA